MAFTVGRVHKTVLTEEQLRTRSNVLAGLQQIKEGIAEDMEDVCDRLEKKYTDAAIRY